MIVILPIIGLFIVLGTFLMNGKGSFIIAGFNAKSEEELKEYDTVAVCKFMGKIMFALSFSMVFWVLGDVFNLNWLDVIGLVFFVGIILFGLVYSNNWKRFKK